MVAMNYRGPFRVRVDKNKPYPEIEHPDDAIIRVIRTCICGSDLHLYHGLVYYRRYCRPALQER